ncbi:MAG: DUF2207 domain-containing protein [Pseudomonadota bacterium]
MNQIVGQFQYRAVLIVIFLLSSIFSARAAEVIQSFDSIVTVAKDGTYTVTETIRVRAEGNKIRRGIYRDFPLLFEDDDGRQKQVGFNLVSVSRDGEPDGSRVEKSSTFVRIYIGEKDYFLPTGNYTYKIVYETDRQIGFFDEGDEVYWNATGNFWDFPIEKATAKIILPEDVSALQTGVFTGRYGSTEHAAKTTTALDGQVVKFTSNRKLAPGEGMTVVVLMPKGSIEPPSAAQKRAWFFSDYRAELISLTGLLITVVYYLFNWVRIGRDPDKGVVVPRWDAPDGISPALTSYIYRKGLSGKGWDAISAAILNLAVKGLVTLENLSGDLHIKATGKTSKELLPVGERALFGVITGYVDGLEVSESQGSKVKTLQNKFQSAMTKEHRSDYYKHNSIIIFGGVALSVATIAATLFFGQLSDDEIGTVVLLAVVSGFICFAVFHAIRAFTSGRGLARKITSVLFAGLFGFFIFSGLMSAIARAIYYVPSSWLTSVLIGIVILNVLFYFLMGAPTPTGQKMMDGIKGMKQYLELAEKDRMNLAGVPEMSPQHYEKLLPYAVALGVEKPWSKAFDAWLAAAIATGAVAASYSPGWYRGRDFNSDNAGNSMRDISDSMQSSMSNAMPVPKSSSSGSSGGGGFSGGGGGGGGGGGW